MPLQFVFVAMDEVIAIIFTVQYVFVAFLQRCQLLVEFLKLFVIEIFRELLAQLAMGLQNVVGFLLHLLATSSEMYNFGLDIFHLLPDFQFFLDLFDNFILISLNDHIPNNCPHHLCRYDLSLLRHRPLIEPSSLPFLIFVRKKFLEGGGLPQGALAVDRWTDLDLQRSNLFLGQVVN